MGTTPLSFNPHRDYTGQLMRGRILLAIILVPLVETWLLVTVGSMIGALPTIGLVILTAVIGSALLRVQGLLTINKIQTSINQGEIPARSLAEGAVLLVAGALLITPGFITDTIGFLCMVPILRERVATYCLRRWVRKADVRATATGDHHGTTIEGDYRRDD